MGLDWYNMIAKRNGGYKSNAIYTVEGVSGEKVFKDRLIKMLPNYNSVLDAGCGHGEFTLEMAKYTDKIIGFDYASELLKIARSTLEQRDDINNVKFVKAYTKSERGLPFRDNQFDLIYDRRGPTSIINHKRILKSGGKITGIHPAALDKVKLLLEENGFINIEIEIFDSAFKYFPNRKEFARYISAIPGNPDYTLPENQKELAYEINKNMNSGRISLQEWRYIWKAEKP